MGSVGVIIWLLSYLPRKACSSGTSAHHLYIPYIDLICNHLLHRSGSLVTNIKNDIIEHGPSANWT